MCGILGPGPMCTSLKVPKPAQPSQRPRILESPSQIKKTERERRRERKITFERSKWKLLTLEYKLNPLREGNGIES